MTLGLFFPFQMFPTELLKGEVGTDLGSLQTKKVNHDCTTNRQRTLHREQPDTFFFLLKKNVPSSCIFKVSPALCFHTRRD